MSALRKRWSRWFQRKHEAAQVTSEDPQKVAGTAEQALFKARGKGKLRKAWEDLQVLIRLARAWGRGEYREVSRTTIVLVVAALAYFISPIDAILDSIPLAGYLDDAAIIGWVVSEIKVELDAFRGWEQQPRLPPMRDQAQA
jgi:uncharacterized membrane protein YkvA (DUF1232 family)